MFKTYIFLTNYKVLHNVSKVAQHYFTVVSKKTFVEYVLLYLFCIPKLF